MSLTDLDSIEVSGQVLKAAETSTHTKDGNLFPVVKEAKQAKKGEKAQPEDETPGSNGVEKQ